MCILSIKLRNVQVQPALHREGLKELFNQLELEIQNFSPACRHVIHQKRAAAEIHDHAIT